MAQTLKTKVTASAKAVDRKTLADDLLGLFKARTRKPVIPVSTRKTLDEKLEDIHRQTPPWVDSPKQRKVRVVRRGYDNRNVTWRSAWNMPRRGTLRYFKAAFVKEQLEKEGNLPVWKFIGKRYCDDKSDTLTLHDLEVMQSKGLIKIEEN